nr:MAG TPA: hypothetical protein [Caudoviricetes sp.]
MFVLFNSSYPDYQSSRVKKIRRILFSNHNNHQENVLYQVVIKIYKIKKK